MLLTTAIPLLIGEGKLKRRKPGDLPVSKLIYKLSGKKF
jgi:hypothetical protein